MKSNFNRFSGKNQGWAENSRPKTSDRLWSRRVLSNSKVHPIVTIYHSSVKVEPQFTDTMEKNQTKRKHLLRKEIEMHQVKCANHPSIDSAFIENPDAIVSFPSANENPAFPENTNANAVAKPNPNKTFSFPSQAELHLPRVGKSEKDAKRFCYFTKI